jgi:hypothetical protein
MTGGGHLLLLHFCPLAQSAPSGTQTVRSFAVASQQPELQRPPVQQGWLAPPHCEQLPSAQASPEALHEPPAQQGSMFPPHCAHTMPLQAKPAAVQVRSLQQASPAPPHFVQLLLMQVTLPAVQVIPPPPPVPAQQA